MLVIENCNSLSDLRQKLIDGEEVRTAKQEPCEDVIRREDAINAVSEALEHVFVEHEDIAKKMINKLPSVKPQESCKDAINRAKALEAIRKLPHAGWLVSTESVLNVLSELPPVTPLEQESYEDVIRRKDALQALCKAVHKNDDTIPCSNQRESCLWSKTKVQDYAREIWKVPPATPQPKTGHWIYRIYGEFHEQGDWYCSKCDYPFNYGYGHAEYCPKCGCKMSEAPTEEVIGDRDYDWVIKR